jgi:multicomponent Na+:H+ antiporter subunit A
MAVVAVVAVVAAVAVLGAPSHVAGVLTLSVLGSMLAILYVQADAPDLALTQLVVKTLVLVLFLLVLHRLPAFYGDADRGRVLRDGALAVVVGVTVAVTVLVTTAASPNDALARYLSERAGLPAEHGSVLVDWGGGGNAVNVILVDFRGIDTLGEISVVAMAALAVLTLIRMRDRGETP